MSRVIKLYHLPDVRTLSHSLILSFSLSSTSFWPLSQQPQTKGLRTLEPKDVPQATKVLSDYLKKFHLAATFNEEEFAHWFMPRENIVNSYVVEVCLMSFFRVLTL